MNTLSFGYRQTERNGTTKTNRTYLDFIVSNQSLGQLLELTDEEKIGVFGWTQNIEYENKEIAEFIGVRKPELSSGRTCFYVCPECGDIGCGAITAKIEIKDNQVIWKDFGFENNDGDPDLLDYQKIGPFIFDKTEYIRAFETIIKK